MPINFSAVGETIAQEMNFRKDTPRQLGKTWGVSHMSIVNATKGKPLSVDLFMRVCIYVGADPRVFWVNDSVVYEGMDENVQLDVGYPV